MADEREKYGTDEWPTDEGVSGGTEGGVGTGSTGSDTEAGSDTGLGYEAGVGSEQTGGESWTDPGSEEDITRHSGP
jgi:hypothetical protein